MKIDTKNFKHGVQIKLILMVSVLSLLTSRAYASSTTATVTLSALINEMVSISITPAGGNGNLNVNTSQVDVPVATVYENSNSANGYLVKARSENNGKIQSTQGADNIPYYIRYGGGTSLKLSDNDQTVKEQNIGGVYNSVNKDITISFQGVPATNLRSGSYRDIITFTIESK